MLNALRHLITNHPLAVCIGFNRARVLNAFGHLRTNRDNTSCPPIASCDNSSTPVDI